MTCHTGGAQGADMFFEEICEKHNIDVKAYSFDEHSTKSKHRVILTLDELKVGHNALLSASKLLKKSCGSPTSYVGKLLHRNYYQVENAEIVYAVANRLPGSKDIVQGGTGWACALAIQMNKPLYLFDQNYNFWFRFVGSEFKVIKLDLVPDFPEHFAGIGTRNLTEVGKIAIKLLFDRLK